MCANNPAFLGFQISLLNCSAQGPDRAQIGVGFGLLGMETVLPFTTLLNFTSRMIAGLPWRGNKLSSDQGAHPPGFHSLEL